MKCNVANGWCPCYLELVTIRKMKAYPDKCMDNAYNDDIKNCPHRLMMNRLGKAYKKGVLYVQLEKEIENEL